MEHKNDMGTNFQNNTDSSRRKTDIFYGDPMKLLEAARSGGVSVEELREFLIHIKKPGKTEMKLIEMTDDVEILVTRILEQGSEVIDYGKGHLSHHHGTVEDLVSKAEIAQKKYTRIQERMGIYFSQEIDEMDPGFLEREDIVRAEFTYTKDDENIRFSAIFSINGLYSSRITGDCYLKSDYDGGKFSQTVFSLPLTSLVIKNGRRRVDVFSSETLSEIPPIFRDGLHERFIESIHIYSKEQKKFSQKNFLERLFGRHGN